MDGNDLSVMGRIFNIQRFSVHDGPGIRTIVFFKGCAFRCKWCCNPESQSYQIEKMIYDGEEKIQGRDVSVGEVIETVLRDRAYYERSNGGLTLSGGECLLQSEFCTALLKCAKYYGINTAIESTGFASFSVIEKILPYLDLYLMDIKHMDCKKHEKFTTKPNTLVLENAVKIAKNAKELIIRVPVIPTFNDTEEEIFEIAKFASSLHNVKEIHLLPYHRLGMDKYQRLGREYELKDILPPDDEKMERLKNSAKRANISCVIGG